MTYVDGAVIAVPNANKDAYRELSEKMGPILKKHGALSVADCWGVDVPDGEVTSFPMAVKKEVDETIVFSWITWPSKAARDAGSAAAMQECADTGLFDGELFDGKRMIFGSFEMLAHA